MLGHRRAADRQLGGKLTHRAWSLGQALDDGAPGRVTECAPSVFTLVSGHER
jgi:hypothetical protein